MRILVAGFQHETNTFAPSKADWAAFHSGAGYPELTRGAAMLERIAPTSLPMGGFIRDAAERRWQLVPSVWAGATPSAHVTEDAFERIAAMLLEDAQRERFDAVYLDLHGAAVAEHVDDAEGELLERLRAVVGPALPVVASLDLHANVTDRMLRLASALTAFRTYPHVDQAETGARAAALLATLVARGPFATCSRRLPFLLPLNAQCTMMEPAAGVFADLAALEAQSGVHLSFAMGFPAADFAECGPVVFGHGHDTDAVQANVQALAENAIGARADWRLELLPPDEAVAQALELAAAATKPVVVADTQDNPGAGGDSNTTGLLHALRRAGAGRRFPGAVALGLLHDPAAAAAACAAGVGAALDLSIGKAVRTFDGATSDPPFDARFTVTAVSDGRVPLHGPMTAGNTAQLGLSACVETEGLRILLVTGKTQMLDLALYRFLGVEPAAMKLLVNKSSVHFRAAFTPIASHILVARAPGPMAADPADLPWRRLPASIARRPLKESLPMTDLAFRSATSLLQELASGELTSLALLRHQLERVERLNPRFNAVVTLDADRALARAAEADAARSRGERWGPLHGLPMTVKDSFETAGLRTTSGAPELAGHVPARHAVAVQRLVDAGAVVFGKTNLPTFAMDVQSFNPLFGTTNNPWDTTRSPGGSSGGAAAALAAGLTPLELGSDIGGSIRNPAHFCGVYGLKPSYGLVPQTGHIPGPPGSRSEPDIAVAGPMARSAEDLALALEVLAGPAADEAVGWHLALPPPRQRDLRAFRVAAWLDDPESPVDAAVRSRLEALVEALRRAGVEVDTAARPAHGLADALAVYYPLLFAATSPGLAREHFAVLVEKAAEDRGPYDMARGSTMRHRQWLSLHEKREKQRANWARFFTRYDVLLCPAAPTAAIRHDHGDPAERRITVNGESRDYWDQVDWAGLVGAALLPATVAPAGRTAEGLPVGVQIVGPYLEDRTTIEFARLIAPVAGAFEAPPGL